MPHITTTTMGGTMTDPAIQGLRNALAIWQEWKRREAAAMLRIARALARSHVARSTGWRPARTSTGVPSGLLTSTAQTRVEVVIQVGR